MFLENPGKMINILEAALPGDFPNAVMGTHQQFFCMAEPAFQQKCSRRPPGRLFEDPAEMHIGQFQFSRFLREIPVLERIHGDPVPQIQQFFHVMGKKPAGNRGLFLDLKQQFLQQQNRPDMRNLPGDLQQLVQAQHGSEKCFRIPQLPEKLGFPQFQQTAFAIARHPVAPETDISLGSDLPRRGTVMERNAGEGDENRELTARLF